MNQLQLVTLDQARLLKSIGFTWETEHYFMGSGRSFSSDPIDNHNREMTKEKYSRPTIAHALMFLREVKGVHGWVQFAYKELPSDWSGFYMRLKERQPRATNVVCEKDPDVALTALLTEILKIVSK